MMGKKKTTLVCVWVTFILVRLKCGKTKHMINNFRNESKCDTILGMILLPFYQSIMQLLWIVSNETCPCRKPALYLWQISRWYSFLQDSLETPNNSKSYWHCEYKDDYFCDFFLKIFVFSLFVQSTKTMKNLLMSF
jgi:hypothetical protein